MTPATHPDITILKDGFFKNPSKKGVFAIKKQSPSVAENILFHY